MNSERFFWILQRWSVVGFAALLLAAASSAEAISPTYFSRENCGNNESITWDPTQATYNQITAVSYHIWTGGGEDHVISDERTMDNAAKAIHWGEGVNMPLGDNWSVTGIHTWTSGEWWMGLFYTDGQGLSSAIGC